MWEFALTFLKNGLFHLLLLSFSLMAFFMLAKGALRAAGNFNRRILLILAALFFFSGMIFPMRTLSGYFYYYFGLQCISEYQFEAACEEFYEAVRLYPGNDGFRKRLAETLLVKKKYAEAAEQFSLIREMSPDTRIRYGIALFESGRIPESSSHFSEARDHAYNPMLADYYLGRCLMSGNDFCCAEKYFSQALANAGSFKNMVRWEQVKLFQAAGRTVEARDLAETIIREPGPERDIVKQAGEFLSEHKNREYTPGDSPVINSTNEGGQ